MFLQKVISMMLYLTLEDHFFEVEINKVRITYYYHWRKLKTQFEHIMASQLSIVIKKNMRLLKLLIKNQHIITSYYPHTQNPVKHQLIQQLILQQKTASIYTSQCYQ